MKRGKEGRKVGGGKGGGGEGEGERARERLFRRSQ